MQVTEVISWIGSLLAMVAFLQGVLPTEYREYVGDRLKCFLSPYNYFVIPEFEGASVNELYVAVQCYLSTVTATRAHVSNLSMSKNTKNITCSLANNQRVFDTFGKVKIEWLHRSKERRNSLWTLNAGSNSDERRSFQVKMHRADKDYLLESYFSYITARAKEIQRANRDLLLYSNKRNNDPTGKTSWNSIPFLHPATFDTIALDPELKLSILKDLDEFVDSEGFYRRVGKAWKRGYLLFGPPGTGKSSVVAAIANKLRYDIYDLELTEVESNAELRKLLLHTSNKSLVVIEDIDCSLDLTVYGQRKRKNTNDNSHLGEDITSAVDSVVSSLLQGSEKDLEKTSRVTLSGLLNFTDGLWSSCGSERIFIFTTNFVNKLDPALLRPGRMDMHIHLSYCTFPAFKTLAKNFLQIQEHCQFEEVEREMQQSFLTPAQVAEVLTRHKHHPDLAIKMFVETLRAHKLKPPPLEYEKESFGRFTEKELPMDSIAQLHAQSRDPELTLNTSL